MEAALIRLPKDRWGNWPDLAPEAGEHDARTKRGHQIDGIRALDGVPNWGWQL
jgi:hypothetical protein